MSAKQGNQRKLSASVRPLNQDAECPAAASILDIRVIDSVEEFRQLRKDWDGLLHASTHATVFNSWEWQYYWWKHYGGCRQLRLLAISRNRKLIGIAPFYIRNIRLAGLTLTNILQLIGSGSDTSPDYLDLICLPEDETEICKRVVSFILEEWNEWDVIHWTDMPETSLLFREFTHNSKMVLKLEQGISSRISQIELPSSWDEFMTSLTAKMRNKIRNRFRHIVTDINGRFFIWQDGNSLNQALDTLIGLHRQRWKDRTRNCAFSSDAYTAFHRDIFHAFHARGWLRLYCLAIEDKVIAMDYCYKFNGTVMQFQRGFDPKYLKQSPGFVLMIHSIQEAIMGSQSLFDFLKGEYAHKKEFETHSVTTRYLDGYRPNGPGRSYRLLSRTRKQVKSFIKQTIWLTDTL